MFRSPSIAALLALAVIVVCSAANASEVCDRLHERLSNLPTVVASNANLRDYTGAISRQNLDLRRAKSDRRRLGCSSGSIIVVGGPNEAECGSLEDMISQMELNLDTLKARRQFLVSGTDGDVQRRRLMAALRVNKCDGDQSELLEASAGEPETHRNIIADLPPIGETGLSLRGSVDDQDFAVPGADENGKLRTMCVRTCDGAFFPISSNASPADFQRDAETCQRRCPGAQTELYYHSLTTEETDRMVSARTGEPYASLPSAFAYKTRDLSQPGQCGCRPVKAAAVKQSTPADTTAASVATAQKPVTEITRIVIPDRPYDPANSKVRIVGPSFLPPQESAIDLRHPAGPQYQPLETN